MIRRLKSLDEFELIGLGSTLFFGPVLAALALLVHLSH